MKYFYIYQVKFSHNELKSSTLKIRTPFQTANTPRKSFFSATWRFGLASCGA